MSNPEIRTASPSIKRLRALLLDQIFAAFGRPLPRWLRFLLTPLFWPIAQRFARLIWQLDGQIEKNGIVAAARWFLPHFVANTRVHEAQLIPSAGSALIAGNHPGAYDILALISNLPREDIKIIVSDEQFYRSLPHLDPFFIYVTHDAHNRMTALRHMLEHLRNGGLMIIFPTGEVDPDPAILPGAREALETWSDSLEILLRKTPATSLVVAITSGVLSPKVAHHPLTRIPRQAWQQRKLAEFFQVMLQFTFGVRFNLVPCVSFSLAGAEIAFNRSPGPGELREIIQRQAQRTLAEHMEYYYGESHH